MNRARSVCLALFVCFTAVLNSLAVTQPAHPHVLFIAIDDLNDWVGPLGGRPQVKTPNMDRLAKRGTTFLNAHCQAPLCNPSRTSLLTGLRPSTTGVYALNPWFRDSPALTNIVTLPQYFMQHGYKVVTSGKIFHDAYPPTANRTDGKEFSVWGRHGGFLPRPKEKLVKAPDSAALIDWGIFPERDEDCFDYTLATYAVEQLKSAPTNQPFFLCVGLRHPHVPCYAPQKWFDLYPEEKLAMPPIKENDRADTPPFSWYLHWKLPEPRLSWLRENGQWRSLVRAYLASVSFVDAQVGRVLDALETSGLRDNTVVVLWSDHGWHLGEKGITGKTTLWERSTHVPLIFAGPGIAKNARCSRPAELLDLYPTLVDLCGLPKKDGLEGHTLLPQLRNAKTPRAEPAITTHGQNNHAIRSEKWRYIRYADGSEELYDIRKDPNEWTNLAGNSKLAGTKRELARWLPRTNAAPLAKAFTRLVEIRDGKIFWEGKPVDPGEKPE
jgi:arylsulfatase A-like enzyme